MHLLSYSIAELMSQEWDASILSPLEKEAYAQRGHSYLAIRSQLKCELARLAGCKPQDVELALGRQGKPYWPAEPSLHFNLSHSKDKLLLAIDSQAIGVDIEHMRPRAFARICTKFMPAEQAQDFIARGASMQEFYTQWCAREALIKLQGGSMWHACQLTIYEEQGLLHAPQVAGIRLKVIAPDSEYMAVVAQSIELPFSSVALTR